MNTALQRLMEQADHYLHLGQTEQAMDALRQALAQDPDFADAHALLAICLLDQRRLHAASHEAGLALAQEPDLALAHYAKARILIGQRKFQDAKKHLELIIGENPQVVEFHRSLALLYELTRREDLRHETLQRALTLDPQDAETLAQISRYHMDHGDVDAAQRYAQEALQAMPEQEDALIAMGHVLLKRKRLNDAREHAIWALRHNPANAQALHLLAAVKARNSLWLGLWWRYNSWMSSLGDSRSILVLLFAFIVYRIASIASADLGHAQLSNVINFLWLGLVLYTFIAPQIFHKALKKEMASVKLREDF